MIPRLFVLSCAVLLTTCTTTRPPIDHPWSQPANGIQARFQFEAGELIDDTHMTRVFLELRNISDIGGPLYLLFDESACLRSELYDAAGRSIEMNGGPGNIRFSPPYFVCIPCNASIRLDVTAYGWGVGKGTKALIGLHDNCWAIEQSDSSPYFLRGTFTAKAFADESLERLRTAMSDLEPAWNICQIHHVWAGTLEIPKTSIDVLK